MLAAHPSASVVRIGADVRTAARDDHSVDHRLDQAADDLAESTGKVRSAAAALGTVAAQRRVDRAGARVEDGRQSRGRLARRSYQQGPLGDIQPIFTAADPQDLLDRSALLEQVFQSQNDSIHQLSVDRLAFARTTGELAVEEAVVVQARGEAQQVASRAQRASRRAERAAARVAALVAARRGALRSAESARTADLEDYRQAQADSRALAARIRAAAARLAASRAAARRAAAARAAERRSDAADAGDGGGGDGGGGQGADPPASGGALSWPVNGPLTSSFGYRRHPIFGDVRFHAGVDFGAGPGAPVSAADGGVVLFAGWGGGYGNLVVIAHDGDLTTAYAHLSSMSVSTGQGVSRGQTVGAVGSTGNSTGPHLHFETRRDGNPVNPLAYIG